ncbi:MAG: NAD(P)/FAD-dependent oxidoreductase [Pseudomonadota bacterium]
MKIAIVGAGIAGLASATFLARQGHEVTVYDQFSTPRPVGSGLMLQPVGMAVLARIGLADAAEARAAPITRVVGRNPAGRAVLDLRYQDLRPDAKGLGIQRGALFLMLLSAAKEAGATLMGETSITGISGSGARPCPVSEGNVLPAVDLLIDALGSGSPLCPKPSRPLAYGALWGLLDWPADGPFDPDNLAQRYQGATHMVGVLPVGTLEEGAPKKLTFFWSLRGRDLAAWRAQPLENWKQEVSALWPDTADLLDQISSHDDLIFAQYTHRTLPRPDRGPVVHIGDSFHAASPQLGQGANMALLDALALAEAVQATATPAQATAAFARLRLFHVRLYQTASYLFTPVYQSDSRVLPWLRDRVAAPLSRMWPMPGLLAQLVTGELTAPVDRILGADRLL